MIKNLSQYPGPLKGDRYIPTISWTRWRLNLIPCHAEIARLIRTIILFMHQKLKRKVEVQDEIKAKPTNQPQLNLEQVGVVFINLFNRQDRRFVGKK